MRPKISGQPSWWKLGRLGRALLALDPTALGRVSRQAPLPHLVSQRRATTCQASEPSPSQNLRQPARSNPASRESSLNAAKGRKLLADRKSQAGSPGKLRAFMRFAGAWGKRALAWATYQGIGPWERITPRSPQGDSGPQPRLPWPACRPWSAMLRGV